MAIKSPFIKAKLILLKSTLLKPQTLNLNKLNLKVDKLSTINSSIDHIEPEGKCPELK